MRKLTCQLFATAAVPLAQAMSGLTEGQGIASDGPSRRPPHAPPLHGFARIPPSATPGYLTIITKPLVFRTASPQVAKSDFFMVS